MCESVCVRVCMCECVCECMRVSVSVCVCVLTDNMVQQAHVTTGFGTGYIKESLEMRRDSRTTT